MKLFTLSAALVCLASAVAQAPVIEGTYLPVRNTAIEQVWDTTSIMVVPTTGANQTWDYSNSFTNIADTFYIRTYDPASTPHAALFPGANQVTYVRTPTQLIDSLWYYIRVDTIGVNAIGVYNEKVDINAPLYAIDEELNLPLSFTMGTVIYDTAIFQGDFIYQGINARYKQYITKEMSGVGYGTVSTPLATWSNVLLAKEVVRGSDSIFIDPLNTGSYSFFQEVPRFVNRWHFMRNNTFATTVLMFLNSDTTDSYVYQGYYTLPVEFGSIAGQVFDTTGLGVVNGEMLLYRENSNFAKNDILAVTQTDANGNFQFDSIPYGEYRIAVRADQMSYPNSLTTYNGDTTNWLDCTPIITSGPIHSGSVINLQYHDPNAGAGQTSGTIYLNLGFTRNNDPIPGIDVVVRRNPSGVSEVGGLSNTGGDYDFTDLEDGNYTLFVDIPGLHMAGSYDFTVLGSTVDDNMDFIVGLDSIYPLGGALSIPDLGREDSPLTVFPNPSASTQHITFALDGSAQVQLFIASTDGRMVKELYSGKLEKGHYAYQLENSDFDSAGMYLLNLILDGQSYGTAIIRE